MRFNFKDIEVCVYVGSKKKHTVLSMKVGPPVATDEKVLTRASREREFEVPSPEIFPADLYTELIASQALEVEDELARAFFDRDKVARDEMLRRAAQKHALFTSALDFAAGVLGLRLHHILVDTPIDEQCFAYRKKGDPYAFTATVHYTVADSYEWDISDGGITATRKRLPPLQPDWTWERAAEVLAWLLRAWAAKDSVLEFVSLFTPLECVIPGVPKKELKGWEKNRQAMLALAKEHAKVEDRSYLSRPAKRTRAPGSPNARPLFKTETARRNAAFPPKP